MTRRDNRRSVLRQGEATQVTHIELFFDVVYVLAVTQLTELLLSRLTPLGAVEVALLTLAVWWAWVDTAWITNWFDPDRPLVRGMLVTLMGISLVMSSAIPEAYGERGLWFAGAYVTLEVGRCIFVVATLGEDPGLRDNFRRMLIWRVTSAPLWLAGGVVHGSARLALWATALAIDTTAAVVGFYIPKVGRSRPADWSISGSHLAERARLFIIIALGESILVTGSVFADLPHDPPTLTTFAAAFLGTVALWWIYFDRSADAAQRVIDESDEPGRLGRSAYTYSHIPMVAGIIVTAVADDLTLKHPTGAADPAVVASVLGGPVLFLIGYVLFKKAIFGSRPKTHLVAIVVLLAMAPLGMVVDPMTLTCLATLVVAATAAHSTFVVTHREPTNR
ncbi:low temperature requirement protein A [Plantactinospora soyae]|uniref:Low temperature requirement protein LtrA n=1 Tax=Plantactinospora soyae TaxID=1544732 RepID=A0A927MBE5_9ACTN|nr:low temperature requirement protein A [Plantactinospora soyae]MBE1490041.1 low temperature requirement protein LtrA [Plantactinospora soyae]